jgi:hypothetical protein|tara:strand:+ start:181 stop:372 length:192 start_codon:yes stop_codon:yes gene_type:complete
MIEYLTFIDELKEIQKYKHCPMMIKAIDVLIEKYNIKIKEFEDEYAPREIEKTESPLIFPVNT